MYDPARYNWSVRTFTLQQLETTLDGLGQGWEVFAVLPYGDGFAVIIRRPA